MTALSGCGFRGGTDEFPTVTPAPVPTDTPSPTPAATPTPPTTADMVFEVSVLQGFTGTSPARLAATFRNTGDRLLTGVGPLQHVLPFVDDDYAGVDESGQLGLFLVPDDTALTVQPEGSSGGPVEAFLPGEPANGCWTLPFDWPAAKGPSPALLHTVSVPPGDAVRHEYGVYYLDGCEAGRYTFESTFDLTATDPPLEGALYQTRLGFDLTITPAQTVGVDVHEPRIRNQQPTD